MAGLLCCTAHFTPTHQNKKMKEKKQWKETHGENFVPWVSFFLLAGLAKHTPGEVAEFDKSFLLRSARQGSRQSMRQRLCPWQEQDRMLATKQGQALQINEN